METDSYDHDEDLTRADLGFILESLKYTKIKFEEYDSYPSYEFKRKKVQEVEKVMTKVRKLMKDWVE